MTVIAESVAQRRVLADHGCLRYRHYLFYPPRPVAQFCVFVQRHYA